MMEFERCLFWLVIVIVVGIMLLFIIAMCRTAAWADRFCTMQEPEEDKFGIQVDPWEQTVDKQDRDGSPGP